MAVPATSEYSAGSPYADAAALYWAAGWRGILPLPPHAKKPVPSGWTGREGQWPSWADIYAWAEDRAGANLALRMPRHVIGIDVDAYGDKIGAQTLAEAEAKWGTLPPTWRSTSRDDGTSGIRLYRVPEGLSWPGEVGPDIETIRWSHRYTVAWPSIHPEGGTYRWVDPNGVNRIGDVPLVDDLPDLPEAWVVGLTGGEVDSDLPKANLDDVASNAWLVARNGNKTCKAMRRGLNRYLHDLTRSRGSRHDAGLHGQRRLTALTAEGHTGGMDALGELYTAFIDAATRPGGDQRTTDEARAEWQRGLAGAIKLAAAQPEGDGDPCDAPFGDLVITHQPSNPAVPDPIPAPHQPAAPEPTGEPPTRERTSWWPVDLESAITGDNPEPEPAYLSRDDQQPLIYPAKVNGIIGASESGKTWIALLAAQQALADSINVTYLDFEDTAPGIVQRLLDMSTSADQIRAHLSYIGPDHALDTLSSTDLAEHLDTQQPGLVIVDGVNAAMTLLGLDLISNTDATRFAQTLLRPISARGAAVIYVDHKPKSRDNDSKGGIGAQAKRAMTTGAAFKVEVIKEFGKGQDGKLRMRVDKDRPGHIRGISLPGKDGHWAGDVTIKCLPDEKLDVSISTPRERTEVGPFRPTHLMEKVSRFLATVPDGASKRTIEREVSGDNNAKRAAVDVLVDEGYAERSSGSRGAVVVRHRELYTEISDLAATSLDLAGSEVDKPPRRSSSAPSAATPLEGGSRGSEVAEVVRAAPDEDQNNTTSLDSEERTCRACGEILGNGRLLVGGRCSDCISARREATS